MLDADEQTLGRYRLLRLLGQGGVGQVHLGCSHGAAGFEKLVAIKVLKSELTKDHEQARYLRDEAHIGVGLEHQHIVQILDLGQEGSNYFVVMEYIRGFSLAKSISFLAKGNLRMPVDIAAHIFRAIASALDYVHSKRSNDDDSPLFHGDISAANIMLGSTGRIALADFGVAALIRHRPEQLAGKWSYVPPEALLGARVNFSWDLFALGALLYEMLAGRKAFPSTSFKTRSQAPEVCPPLAEVRSDIAPELSALVAQFVTPVVSDRPQSVRDMRRALDRLVPPTSDDEHRHYEYFQSLYQIEGFRDAFGELPSTSSIKNAIDPFMEETEQPTVPVRVSKPLRFGLSLAHGADKAKRSGELLGTVLTRALQRPLRPVLLGDYQTLLDCLLRGDVDIAWMPPMIMAKAVEQSAGIIAAIERSGSPSYHGALFTQASSGIMTIDDLRGRSVGWVDTESASGYRFPKHLVERRLGPVEQCLGRQSFFGSHMAVAEAVANGWVDVGGGYVVTDSHQNITSTSWQELLSERSDELRLIETSLPIPSDCIAHRPHLSEQWREEIETALLALHQSPDGAELLECAFRAERFVSSAIETYEAIKDVF